ncbi:MAG: hypothetical protein WAQ27_02765 [Candidatus Microsaccharimonas sp.]
MDIKGKLAPIAQQVTPIVVSNALAVEQKILRLPRPYRKVSSKVVGRVLYLRGFSTLFLAHAVHTKRSNDVGLKNRELNTFGKIMAVANLAISASFTLIAIHELWARARATNPRSLQEQVVAMFKQIDMAQ